MKNIFLFALLTLTLGISACKKPVDETPKSTLKITFRAVFDSNPLVIFTDCAAPNGDNIQFHALNFMLSDLILVKTNGEEVRISDISFIDFNNNFNITKATEGVTITFNKIDTGSFKGIRFGVGVSSSLNATTPGEYPTTSPLGDAGNYWTAWDSYIFSRVEGQIDTLPTTAGGNVSFLYHAGVDGMYQPRNFSKSFSLDKDQTQEIIFTLEAKNIFHKSGAEIDIPALTLSHSGAEGTPDYELAKEVITNIADALSVN